MLILVITVIGSIFVVYSDRQEIGKKKLLGYSGFVIIQKELGLYLFLSRPPNSID